MIDAVADEAAIGEPGARPVVAARLSDPCGRLEPVPMGVPADVVTGEL
ncbi:hypothetical protein [Kibdelosporangium persicum]|nr:hypothetical protein [Kibdelosporangium persicum]